VAAALAEQIARLNQAGKMSFKDAMGLRVGGMDWYSRWHLEELVVRIAVERMYRGVPSITKARSSRCWFGVGATVGRRCG